jgi:hypothetical protein
MMKKMSLLVAGGIGYVLGTRAGRERYEQIKNLAVKVKDNPTVQEKAHQATDVAKAQAPVVKEKITNATEAAKSKVGGGSSSSDPFPDESLLNQEDPYPRGNLP